ncbi:hypothetical protein G7050_10140 [Dysgonomonas sp. HDW5A]|uniref:Ppx/GppA phosphatase family protein n=1 Tax=Dysgonomonas sp. HDW5A TaxID=2714926 RepID=UPI00140E70F7|nr:hypothetical protein [Dysgonomonas sp. HDW5A]QIK60169.1 hypothetical protein G7050_10140 [Dysgonomonas sp. HDW5A]
MDTKRFGAIDIGSNSVRLLITDVIDYKGKPYFKKNQLIRIPLKLGEDTFSTGFIGDQKKEKLMVLMQSLQGLISVNDVEVWRACATSAIREAENAREVLNYVENKTGVHIEIIDPIEEAHYIRLNNMDEYLDEDRAYIFTDVGGGSTELILFYKNEQIATGSFRLGTLRTLTPELEQNEWDAMKDWMEEHCKNFPKVSLIGSGGNINKLDSLLRRCGRIKREELIAYYRKLRSMSYEERVINLKVSLDRAEVIMPAIHIYLKIMKLSRALVIETPIIGVADGIIKDLYLKDAQYQSALNRNNSVLYSTNS